MDDMFSVITKLNVDSYW